MRSFRRNACNALQAAAGGTALHYLTGSMYACGLSWASAPYSTYRILAITSPFSGVPFFRGGNAAPTYIGDHQSAPHWREGAVITHVHFTRTVCSNASFSGAGAATQWNFNTSVRYTYLICFVASSTSWCVRTLICFVASSTSRCVRTCTTTQ